MTTERAATSLTVWKDADGLICVAEDRAAARALTGETLFRADLEVSGGSLSVDVRDPGLALSARIDDIPAASWWIEHVFGPAVADAVLTAGPDAVECAPADGAFADLAARLAMGLWLRRWWPAKTAGIPAIEEWMLDAELGELAWTGESLFGDADLAERLLAPHVTVLAGELRDRILSGADDPDSGLGQVVYRASRAAIDSVDPQQLGYHALSTTLRAVEVQEAAVRAGVDALISQALSDAKRERQLASVAGSDSGGSPVTTGFGYADWESCNPRSLDNDPGAIAWEVTETPAGLWINVAVRAVTATRSAELYARVILPGSDPISVALDWSPGSYHGAELLPVDVLPDGVRVIIRDDDSFGDDDLTEDAADRVAAAVSEFIRARRALVAAGSLGERSAPMFFEQYALAD